MGRLGLIRQIIYWTKQPIKSSIRESAQLFI